MIHPHPIHDYTSVNNATGEWWPKTFDAFVAELEHLKRNAETANSLLLFRGHSKRNWRLDSSFVRAIKSSLFKADPEYGFSDRLRDTAELNTTLSSLLLLKFGTIVVPSAELVRVAESEGIDPWFELMKRYQQYPNEDLAPFGGTNLVDWSKSSDIALYFANEARNGAGAIFVCDATATGKTLQAILVEAVLGKIQEQITRRESNGVPLLFSPLRQIAYQRAKNQQAVYFAQMDLRIDLSEHWRIQEQAAPHEAIVLKIILPEGSERSCDRYLASKGIDSSFIYPDGRS